MAKLICMLEGVRGRVLKLYDTKAVIITKKTAGSFITGNFTDGEKTIFLRDVVGVQFKQSGGMIGYLQFETPSMQMNNKSDNMFSENTFTFEDGKNGVTNKKMAQVYAQVVNQIEALKYGQAPSAILPTVHTEEDPTPSPAPSDSSSKADLIPESTENYIMEDYWICGKCKTKNLNTRNDCWSCGQAK